MGHNEPKEALEAAGRGPQRDQTRKMGYPKHQPPVGGSKLMGIFSGPTLKLQLSVPLGASSELTASGSGVW